MVYYGNDNIYPKEKKTSKWGLVIILFVSLAFLSIIMGLDDKSEYQSTEPEPEPDPEPEPIRPTVSSWHLDDRRRWEEKQITGQTEEAQVPNGAVACKVVVYWEGTSPINKGRGRLSINPRKLVDAGDRNDIIHLENEELDVDKSLLNMPGSIELIVYVEEDALYYFFTLYKANIGDCEVEVYFGY